MVQDAPANSDAHFMQRLVQSRRELQTEAQQAADARAAVLETQLEVEAQELQKLRQQSGAALEEAREQMKQESRVALEEANTAHAKRRKVWKYCWKRPRRPSLQKLLQRCIAERGRRIRGSCVRQAVGNG